MTRRGATVESADQSKKVWDELDPEGLDSDRHATLIVILWTLQSSAGVAKHAPRLVDASLSFVVIYGGW